MAIKYLKKSSARKLPPQNIIELMDKKIYHMISAVYSDAVAIETLEIMRTRKTRVVMISEKSKLNGEKSESGNNVVLDVFI